MILNEVKTSFLLSEEETVEMQGILALDNRRWEYAFLCYILGLYLIAPGIADFYMGRFMMQGILCVVVGAFASVFYDFFVLRFFTKRRARKHYREQANRMLSMSFCMDGEQFRIETDKYRLTARPRDVWKCIEAPLLFIVYISSERCFSIPKRALTQQEISEVRQAFEQSLPEGQYVKTGK